MKKRIVSLALAILMLFSLFPLTALAGDGDTQKAGNTAASPIVTFDEIVLAAGDTIRPNEGSYSSVNPNDNGALSIGWIQWHANRALSLLRTIVNKNDGQARTILGDTLYTEVMTASSWSARILTKDEASKISYLIDTEEGRKAQDDLAAADISIYINHAMNLGVTDPSALVFHADIENQCGWGGAKRVLDAAKVIAGSYDKITLEILYKASIEDAVAGKYATRRQKTYNSCLFLEWSEARTELEVWDVLSARNARAEADTSSTLLTTIPKGTKVVVTEKVYYAPESSTRAKTIMGWITLDSASTSLDTELSGGTVPAPINFDTNGGTLPDGASVSTSVNCFNTSRPANSLAVFDKDFSLSYAPTNPYGTEVAISAEGIALSTPVYGNCKTEIPEGGFVLSGHGTMYSWLISNVKKGNYLIFNKESLTVTVYESRNSYVKSLAATELDSTIGELPTPERNGYLFNCWQDSDGNAVTSDTLCRSPFCITLKAAWYEPVGSGIIFNTDGGSIKGTVSYTADKLNASRDKDTLVIYDQGITTGTNAYGMEAIVSSEGYVTAIDSFGTGNNTIPEGGFVISGHGAAFNWMYASISVGNKVTFNKEAMLLTVYSSDEVYDSVHRIVAEGTAIGPLPEAEKPYHRFLGWYTAAGNIASEETLMASGGIVLYAKWEILPGKLILNADGGTLPSLKATATVTGTNVGRGANTLVIMKGKASTGTNIHGTEVLIDKNGTVIALHPYGYGNCLIPEGCYVLSGHGTMSTWLSKNISRGDYVRIDKNNVYVWESEQAYSSSLTKDVMYGEEYGILSIPEKEGSVFLGWFDKNGAEITKNSKVDILGVVTLTAKWEKLNTVAFNPQGGAITTTAAVQTLKGINVSRGADCLVAYAGKASSGTNIYGSEAVVDKNGTVCAIYGYGKGNNSIPEGGFVLSGHGKMSTWLVANVKVGYTVILEGYKVKVYKNAAALDAEDGTVYVKTGSALGALANAECNGKALAGWFFGGTLYTEDTVITSDVSLMAKWSVSSAEIVFNTAGGTIKGKLSSFGLYGINSSRPANTLVVYDADHTSAKTPTNAYGAEITVSAEGIVLSKPVYGTCKTEIPDEGFILSGIGTGFSWLYANVKVGNFVHLDRENMTVSLYESYENYLAEANKTIYTGKPYGPLPTPTKDGYVFGGWRDALGNTVTKDSIVASCEVPVLTAVWRKYCDISFDPAGGDAVTAETALAGINVSRGQNALVLYHGKATSGANIYGAEAVIDSTGKVIAIYGYGKGNAAIPEGGAVLSGHMNAGAWIQTNVAVGSYIHVSGSTVKVYGNKLTYDIMTGAALTLLEGDTVSGLPTLTKKGHTFLGWSVGGVTVSSSFTVTDSAVVTAIWEAKKISVTFDTAGGTFEGLCSREADGTNCPRGSEAIIIYDSDYSKATTGTNIFGAEIVVGADGIVTEERPYGMSNAAIPAGGFVISGHNGGGEWLRQNIEAGNYIIRNGAAFTVYESLEAYRALSKVSATYGSPLSSLPSVFRDGYTFLGWYTEGGTPISAATPIETGYASLTLIAKWEKK